MATFATSSGETARWRGWQVFTLRPAGEARTLLTLLRAHGANARNLPLLRLQAAMPTTLAPAWAQAVTASRWLFSSPAAVRHAVHAGEALARPLHGSDGPWARAAQAGALFAPGPGTAQALHARGIAPVQVPTQRYDSEGLLALPALAAPLSGALVIVGAPDGRGLLERELRERGADILLLPVYHRRPAAVPAAHLHALTTAAQPLLIASSLSLLQRLPAVVAAADFVSLQQRCLLIVSSARLAEQARSDGFHRVFIAASASPDALLAAAQAAVDQAASGSIPHDSVSMPP